MEAEWLSFFGAFGVSAAALFISDKLRSILRTIFRRPRETSLLVQDPDGTRVIEIRGPANLSQAQAQALLKEWRESARRSATADDPQGSSDDSAQRVVRAESDE